MDMGDNAIGWGPRVSADKIGEKLGADGGMGKISLSCELFFFSLALLQVQFQSLSLNLHETQVLSPESVNISNNSWISQVEKGVINSEATSGRGVEDGQLCIF